jgi:hypothetical protein
LEIAQLFLPSLPSAGEGIECLRKPLLVSNLKGEPTVFSMIGGIFRLFGLVLLSVLLASCGGGGGGDDGGFTPEKINVTVSVDRSSVPVNLSGQPPNPALPYTSTITAKVTQSGKPLTADITIARTAGDAAQGSLFKLDDLKQGFQQLIVIGANGVGQAYFHSNTSPGVVTITA